MELWDIYDSNRIKTGKVIARGEALADGEYHIVAMVLIFNSKNEMLIQKRQPHLHWSPGQWTMTAGGAAQSGDTAAGAARRELLEELGISLDVPPRADFTLNPGQAFVDYFLLVADVETSALPLPNDEVAEVKWVSRGQMLEMIESGQSVAYRESFVDYVFELGRKPWAAGATLALKS